VLSLLYFELCEGILKRCVLFFVLGALKGLSLAHSPANGIIRGAESAEKRRFILKPLCELCGSSEERAGVI